MNIQITRLDPDEWAAYRALRLEALKSEPQAFCSTFTEFADKPSSYWRERLEAAARGKDSWLLFARDGNGNLLGMVGAGVSEPGKADIVSMYVAAGARGQGVGRALMAALLDSLKSRGIEKAALQVNRVQEAAVRLYQECGFSVIEELTFRPGDGRADNDYIMEKKLI